VITIKNKNKVAIIILTVPGNEEVVKDCFDHLVDNSKKYDYEVLIWKNDFEG